MEIGAAVNAEVPPSILKSGTKTTNLPNSKTITVKELQEVIRKTVPPRSSPNKICSKHPDPSSVGGASTPWAIVRGPATPEHINAFDEVYPNLLLGDQAIARNVKHLELFEVTHVVNTAEGKKFNQIDTSSAYYRGAGIQYYGIPGVDIMNFPLHKYFRDTADYIHEALESGGRVYVHCVQGLSRSATIVISYLMLKHSMTVIEAFNHVRQKRAVFPNDGFLKQLCLLNDELYPDKTDESQ